MNATTITGPDGRAWVVRTRWGARARWRGLRPGRGGRPTGLRDVLRWLGDAFWLSGGPPSWLLAAAVLAVAIAFAVVVLLPALVFVLETLWALAIAVLAGGARLLGRPWTVEAVTDGARLTWSVKGRGAASVTVARVAGMIARGEDPS